MAQVFNLARVFTATTGTGTMTLGNPVQGWLTFANAGALDGDAVEYSINDGANSEKGAGIYNSAGPTIGRLFIYSSTNSNNAINLSGNAQVFCDASAQNLGDRKSTRLNSSHLVISYAVF